MPAARYWRVFGLRPFGEADLHLSRIMLLGTDGAVLNEGAVTTSSMAPTTGSLSALSSAANESFVVFGREQWSAPSFWVRWDLGSSQSVNGLRVGCALDKLNSLQMITLQSSTDGVSWSSISSPIPAVPWAAPGQPVPDIDAWVSYLSLAQHFDGANGAIVTAGSETVPINFPLTGGGTISTERSMSGGSSLRLASAGCFTASQAAFDLGASDFTLESWVYFEQFGADCSIFAKWLGSGDSWYVSANSGNFVFVWKDASSVQRSLAGGTFTLNKWIHWAVVREGNVISMYMHGVRTATVAFSGSVLYSTLSPFYLGMGSTGRFFIDEARITKGVARISGTSYQLPAVPFFSEPITPGAWNSRARVAAGAPVEATHSTALSYALQARDVEFGGGGVYPFGVEGLAGGSQKARVTLLRARDRLVAREMWSAASGTGEFTDLDVNTQFIAVAQDPSGMMHPVGAAHYPILPESST